MRRELIVALGVLLVGAPALAQVAVGTGPVGGAAGFPGGTSGAIGGGTMGPGVATLAPGGGTMAISGGTGASIGGGTLGPVAGTSLPSGVTSISPTLVAPGTVSTVPNSTSVNDFTNTSSIAGATGGSGTVVQSIPPGGTNITTSTLGATTTGASPQARTGLIAVNPAVVAANQAVPAGYALPSTGYGGAYGTTNNPSLSGGMNGAPTGGGPQSTASNSSNTATFRSSSYQSGFGVAPISTTGPSANTPFDQGTSTMSTGVIPGAPPLPPASGFQLAVPGSQTTGTITNPIATY